MFKYGITAVFAVSIVITPLCIGDSFIECYTRATKCFPTWFSNRMDLDPNDGMLNKQLDEMASGNFENLDEPPDCMKDFVKQCVDKELTTCELQKTIYGSTLKEYLIIYASICDKASCIMLAVKCQKSVDSNQCSREDCFDSKLDRCLEGQTELPTDLQNMVKAGKLFCQQEECVNYLMSIPKGTCSLLGGGNVKYSLATVEDVCQAVPQIVMCALNIPGVCLSIVDQLLGGIGLNIGSISKMTDVITSPAIKNFADVFLYIYFSQEDCVDCLQNLAVCIEDIDWKSLPGICINVEKIGNCVKGAVNTCKRLLLSSVQPLVDNIIEDLINLADWLCGTLSSVDSSTCYSQSLTCINLPGLDSSERDMKSLFVLVGKIISGDGISFEKVCSEMDSVAPCLEDVVNTSCIGYDRTKLLKEFMVVDHAVRLFCWFTSGNFSFKSLAQITWFSDINLEELYKDLMTFSLDSDPLMNYTIQMSLRLESPWMEYYKDMTHPSTMALKSYIEQLLTQMMARITGNWKIIIQTFYEGSIAAAFTVISNTSMLPETKAGVVTNLMKDFRNSQFFFTINDKNYSISELVLGVPGQNTQVVLSASDNCRIYNVLKVCTNGICMEQNGRPVCKCKKDYEGQYCRRKIKKTTIRFVPILILIFLCTATAIPIATIAMICFRRRIKIIYSDTNTITEPEKPGLLGKDIILNDYPMTGKPTVDVNTQLLLTEDGQLVNHGSNLNEPIYVMGNPQFQGSDVTAPIFVINDQSSVYQKGMVDSANSNMPVFVLGDQQQISENGIPSNSAVIGSNQLQFAVGDQKAIYPNDLVDSSNFVTNMNVPVILDKDLNLVYGNVTSPTTGTGVPAFVMANVQDAPTYLMQGSEVPVNVVPNEQSVVQNQTSTLGNYTLGMREPPSFAVGCEYPGLHQRRSRNPTCMDGNGKNQQCLHQSRGMVPINPKQ